MKPTRDSLLLILSSAAAGALFMAVHMVLGRKMDGAEYATVASLFGLTAFLAVPSNTVRLAMARQAALVASPEPGAVWVTLVRRAFSRIAIFGLAGLCLWIPLSIYWQARDPSYPLGALLVLGAIALGTLFSPAVQGTLQGAGRFGWMATAVITNGTVRFSAATVLVFLGFGVTGAMAAVLIGILAAILVSAMPFRRALRETPPDLAFDTGPVYRSLLFMLPGQAGLFLLLNADLILSVHLMEGEALAAFGKAAMLSRVVLYLPFPAAAVMFTRAVREPGSHVLLRPLRVAMFFSILAAAGFSLLPDLAIRIMYGAQPPLAAEMIRIYPWCLLPLVAACFLAHYLWAINRAAAVAGLLPISAAFIAALIVCGTGALDFMLILAFAGIASLAWLSIALLLSRRNSQ